MKLWTVPRDWPGETVFIVGGGPSVAGQDLPRRLAGRRVIVVNSSYLLLPDADYCYTMDPRWLREHWQRVKATFRGRLVTCSQQVERAEALRLGKLTPFSKTRPPLPLSTDPKCVVSERTGLHGAINLAAHLTGAGGQLVLLGADGKRGADGRSHHHAPHRWPPKAGCWEQQAEHLILTPPALAAWGIRCVNASPGTAWDFIWPTMELDAILAGAEWPAPFEGVGA